MNPPTMSDPELREYALAQFKQLAPAKFNKGMAEHNPDGTKGMMRMSLQQLVDSMKEEVIDQWHYIVALEAALEELDD